MPSAIVSEPSTVRRDGLDLHADHAHVGPRGLHRDRDAAGQPAAADRDDDGRQVRQVLEQLEAERSLAGDDVGIVEGMDEREAGLGGPVASRDEAVVDARADDHDARAQRFGRLDLGDRRALRHEHLARHAALPRRQRERLRVVAGASTDDAGRAPVAQRRQPAQRAADLEGPGALQRLRLQHDLATAALAQRRGRQDRRVARDVADRLAGARHVLGRDRGAAADLSGHVRPQSASATMASISTCAPSGSAATPIVERAG
jgi:hypothetical protein